jgi:hypothetical protein
MDPQRPARRVAAIPTLSATGCSGAKLLVLMGSLAEIEQWRLTLTPDTAAADEPSGHRAEELLASDRPVLERDNSSAPLDLGPILRDPIQ